MIEAEASGNVQERIFCLGNVGKKNSFLGDVRLSKEVIESEIIDWWEDERLRLTSECKITVSAIQSRLEEQIHALDKVELIRPKSEDYRRIKARILSDLEMLSRRLHKSIGESAAESIIQTERRLEEDRLSLKEGLPVFASGAAAAGSVGLAAAAMSFATATSTFMVLIPISTVSWPLVAAFGGAAITLGYFSPSFLKWSTEGLRAKYIRSLTDQVEASVFGGLKTEIGEALCPKYLARIDAICEQRLENLK